MFDLETFTKLDSSFYNLFHSIEGDEIGFASRKTKERKKMTQKVMDQCNHSITFTFQHSPTIIEQDSFHEKNQNLHNFQFHERKANKIFIKPYDDKEISIKNVAIPQE
jgi:hypothetical protein